MLKKIIKFLGLANKSAQMLNGQDYTYHILNSDLSDKRYQKKFRQWLHSYLEQSDNLTEKKYKLLFINVLLKDKHQYLYSMIPESKILIQNIRWELIKNNESKLNIEELFPINPAKELISYYHEKISKNYKDSENDDSPLPIDFLNEDRTNVEKLLIARTVYKDFENLGLVGNALINDNIFYIELLLEMQNFKLNNSDIKKIQKRLCSITDSKEYLIQPPFCTDEQLLEKLILNEDYIDALKELQNFYSFKSKTHASLDEDDFSFKKINNLIETRIDYLTLAKELNHFEGENQPTLTKIKKVKI